MSRTYRRKSENGAMSLYDFMFNFKAATYDNPHPPKIDPRSKEGKKRVARYHSDIQFTKEPGPAWFRKMTVERPQRREAKRQLHRYMRDEEFVVILEAKPPLMYWT